MSLLPIIIAPDPRLKLTAEPIEAVDDTIRQLMDDMLETMYDAPGIGLAAPQVGQSCRVIVVDVGNDNDEDERDPICMANPELTWLSDKDLPHEEGCLSLPEHYAEVQRPATIRITYLDRDNKSQELEAGGLLATCIQHEIDHLDGILFVDHVSALKRNMILRKLVKAKKLAAK
jgi:peptide deformylase